MLTLADFLGDLFFATTCVGAVGWLLVLGHAFGWFRLPRLRNKP